MQHRLTYRQHARAVLLLGLPLIGSHVAQFAINLSDAIMLGWYSVEALAAEVLGGTLFFVLFIMGSGFAWAVMPMVASAEASGEETQVRRVTRMGLWASLFYGVLALPVMIWSRSVFALLGQDPDVAELAGQYLEIAGWGIVPALLVMVLKSYLAALERTGVVLWVTLAAVVVNVGINYLLIFGNFGFPEMGVRGAAIASLLVNTAALLALGAYVAASAPEHALFQRFWRPDWEALGAVFRLGWPIGITSLAEVGLFAAASVMMGWLGTLSLAAHGIALQVTSVVFMVHIGLSNVATVRAGQAFGRGDGPALRDGAKVVLGMAGAVAVTTMVMFLVVPDILIGVFLDPDDPDRAAVMAAGRQLLAAAALFQLVDAAQVSALGLLRGVQDTR
ncbi:MAG: MATE family efflux transporter, partial [Roseovarius sp.]|nr:MATE family efflux transporter [Roseovarius sp.]